MTRDRHDPDDVQDPPVPPGAAGDDATWLLARMRGESPAKEPSTAAAYAQLEGLLADLPPVAPPAGWKEGILRRADEAASSGGVEPVRAGASAPAEAPVAPVGARTDVIPLRRRHRGWLIAGPTVAAAAATIGFFVMRAGTVTPALGVSYVVAAGDGITRGSDGAKLHDHLKVTARLADAGAMRVYRDDRVLVAECPRDPACTSRTTGKLTTHELDLALDAPGRYQIVLVVGDAPAATGRIGDDLAAARAAGATIRDPKIPTFTVR